MVLKSPHDFPNEMPKSWDVTLDGLVGYLMDGAARANDNPDTSKDKILSPQESSPLTTTSLVRAVSSKGKVKSLD